MESKGEDTLAAALLDSDAETIRVLADHFCREHDERHRLAAIIWRARQAYVDGKSVDDIEEILAESAPGEAPVKC